MNNYNIFTYIYLRPIVGGVLDKQGNDIIMQCNYTMQQQAPSFQKTLFKKLKHFKKSRSK